MYLPPGFKCLRILREWSYGSPSGLLLLENFLVADRSIGNRVWTAIKVESIYDQALSAFGYLGNSLFRSPSDLLLLENFLVADRSIGNRVWTAIKVESIYDQALSAFGYLGNSLYRSPSGLLLLENFLVVDRSIGNRVWTAIKVRSIYHQALSAFGYFGNGLTAPHPVCCYSKTFWLLTGPSGIGFGPQSKFEVFTIRL